MKSTFAVLTSLGVLVFGLLHVAPAAAQGDTDDPALVDEGKAVFETNCAGCHGLDGTGSSTGRNLIGVAEEADRAQHIMSVTDGKGFMPAWGGELSAEEINAAVTYVRLTFIAPEPEPTPTPEPEAEATESDDAAEDEAEATESEAETELAVTGVGSFELAAAAVALMGAGVMLVSISRRKELEE